MQVQPFLLDAKVSHFPCTLAALFSLPMPTSVKLKGARITLSIPIEDCCEVGLNGTSTTENMEQTSPHSTKTPSGPFLLRIRNWWHYKGDESLYLYPLRTPTKGRLRLCGIFGKTEASLQQKILLKITKNSNNTAAPIFSPNTQFVVLQRGRITLSIPTEDSCGSRLKSIPQFLQK